MIQPASPTNHPSAPRPFSAGWNWRIVGMLALFAAFIAGSVITTDLLATRNRTPANPPSLTSQPATVHV